MRIHLYQSFTGEGQEVKTITFHQLRKSVALLASALKNLGIKKGDRVVGMYEGANEPPRKEHKSVTLVMTETLSNGPYLTLSLLRVTNI